MAKLHIKLSVVLTTVGLALTLIVTFSPNLAVAGKKAKLKQIEVLTPEKLATLDNKEIIYTYDSLGRKDPFQPFIVFTQIEKSIPTDRERPMTPLEKYALNQYKLVGIIIAGDMQNYALVEDPENIGLTVHEGDMIGNMSGWVKEIKFNEVTIEEPYIDIFDKRQTRTINLKLRDLEEESILSLDENN